MLHFRQYQSSFRLRTLKKRVRPNASIFSCHSLALLEKTELIQYPSKHVPKLSYQMQNLMLKSDNLFMVQHIFLDRLVKEN